jgi:hypothetical protein
MNNSDPLMNLDGGDGVWRADSRPMRRQLHWPVASITNPVPPVIVVWLASITPSAKS